MRGSINQLGERSLEAAKIGLLGLGTVGGGTASVLLRNAAQIQQRLGRRLEITHVAGLNIADQTILDPDKVRLTEDAFEVVNDPDVDIIVELIGGYTLAKDLVLKAIANGKHVVTANKALIATHGPEIIQAASARGVNVAYEAAVGGGIPIIKALREGLAANRIQWVAGIINGTGNFILTEMRDKGRDFAEVLKEAQALGYAEADPTFDVEGIDAAHKLTILASLAFGIELQFSKCYTEGISAISPEDVNYADELGYRIKHLGITRTTDNGIEMRVHPTLIPEKRLIANVDGVMNAVLVMGDAVGPTLYYGAGAGAEPTASAVVADIIDTVRGLDIGADQRVPLLGYQPTAMQHSPVMPIEAVETACYLRMTALDKPGVLAEVSEVFAQHRISLEAVLQKEPPEGADKVHLVLVTQKVKESDMNAAIAEVEAFEEIEGRVTRIRLEHLG
jgi:homoserine dehydrogenase